MMVFYQIQNKKINFDHNSKTQFHSSQHKEEKNCGHKFIWGCLLDFYVGFQWCNLLATCICVKI